ncbi:hypothetical protein [Fimbriiglobus ruber]|uniref:Type I restriction enzyme R protein N-terminal domain-containing protein n=1 Tax=Fimbriiglobus ruber TaxID=1908690 RepID=A0A225EFV2_9BACT|nr:hypothetical protein [Fimbriiglobus ruber]OWK47117.1 hypothetical protein FRUB_00816 [Fimbriiglobus ruber]
MAFGDFKFPKVLKDLGLVFRTEDLFPNVPVLAVEPTVQASLNRSIPLASLNNTEKARSEFVIAPILLELQRLAGNQIALFSGPPLDADPARGLNGVCDFVLARSPSPMLMTAPLVAIVEAKNVDLMGGMGQCIATTYAAKLFNENEGRPTRIAYGVCTTGTEWRFLKHEGNEIVVHPNDVYVDNVGKILGILMHFIQAT